jgi:dipeptidase
MMPSSPDAHNKKSKIGGVAGAAGAIQMEPPAEETTAAPPSSPQRKVEDWRKILSEHCNKITDADRERVRQFFEDRVNPDGDTMSNNNNNVYRLKLHEEQSVESGRTVKVTYYLNLDYSNFTSKQTKKRKEYNNK